jgi:transposase
MTDAVLEAQLFTAVGTKQGHRRRDEPDWAAIHRELKRKHVTLQILWDEYIERHPDGYRYSRFCELYGGWASRVSVTMRQAHAGGDKLFVDYAGDTVPVIIDRLTGKTRRAQIFVAVLGASNFTPAFAGAGSMPRRAGPSHSAIGSAPTQEHSRRSVGFPTCWCRTTPRSR